MKTYVVTFRDLSKRYITGYDITGAIAHGGVSIFDVVKICEIGYESL